VYKRQITPCVGTGTFIETAGIYNYTITDANGCIANTNILIDEPSQLIASSSASEILCNGETSTVTITATQGTASYIGTGTFTESAGTYSYTVLDANGCSDITTINITEPETLIVTDNTTNALCNGLLGSSTVIVDSGGTSPCSIVWDDSSTQFTNNHIPINTTFGFTVTDFHGCTYNNTLYVTQPDPINITLSGVDVSCYNGNDGIAMTDNATGGTPPYLYSWSNDENSSTISGLTSGPYTLTVRDVFNCEGQASIEIEQPPLLQVYLSSENAICGGVGGNAYASIVGGVSPYVYEWSNSGFNNNISNVPPGEYIVTVTDDNDCSSIQTTLVNSQGDIAASIDEIFSISCPEECDGILQASSSNGVLPIVYNWTDGNTVATNTELCSGAYIVIITDNWGCTGSTTANLSNPESIALNAVITDTRCFETSDGKIELTISGGAIPYDPIWNNADTGHTITDLPGGEYIVSVTDFNGCTTNGTFIVGSPDELVLTSNTNSISCFGDTDGTIALNATGGITPYTFEISDGIETFIGMSHSSLLAGIYYLSLTDFNGCTDDSQAIIQEPAELTASYIAQNPSCIGNRDGFINISVLGGSEPYLFGWNENFIDIPILSGLTQGTYEIEITDSNNCVYVFDPIILTDEQIDCIKIPNAFTPNGDGINDTWKIENIDLFSGSRTYIYNRWGQELYVGYPSDEWDGKFNSKYVPAGTYLYIVNLYNGTNVYTGTVSVMY